MKTNHKPVKFILLSILSVALLSACLDRRTTGTVLDDQTIELRVIDAIFTGDEIGEESHIKVEVHDSVVLLMGETDSEEKRQLAAGRAGSVANVDRIVNEIKIGDPAGFGGRLNNSWLSSKVNAILVKENPVEGFDATEIKVITADRTVYLMGQLTREEGDRVVEIVRNISGVEKVVKVFSYID